MLDTAPRSCPPPGAPCWVVDDASPIGSGASRSVRVAVFSAGSFSSSSFAIGTPSAAHDRAATLALDEQPLRFGTKSPRTSASPCRPAREVTRHGSGATRQTLPVVHVRDLPDLFDRLSPYGALVSQDVFGPSSASRAFQMQKTSGRPRCLPARPGSTAWRELKCLDA
jgi:hypothetical protein